MTSKAKPRGRPPTGAALTAAERMRRMRARRRAAGLKAIVTWSSTNDAVAAIPSLHRLIDARSLAMHAVIVRKIELDPRLLEIARRNLERWAVRYRGAEPRWLVEWRQILTGPWRNVAALLTEQSDNATRLRQSTPFAGVLTALERKRIYEAFRA